MHFLTGRHNSLPDRSVRQYVPQTIGRRATTLPRGGVDIPTMITPQLQENDLEANLHQLSPEMYSESVFSSSLPRNFQSSQSQHQRQQSFETIVETQPLHQQTYSVSNMTPQGISHSPRTMSRLASEGNVRLYSESPANTHPTATRIVSAPPTHSRQSLSASNSQVELVPHFVINHNPQMTPNSSHQVWNIPSNLSSQDVSQENLQSMLYSDAMDPTMVHQMSSSQHSGADFPVYGRRQSSEISLTSLPAMSQEYYPNGHPDHTFMMMQPRVVDSPSPIRTLNPPMHAVPMARSRSQVYTYQPMYTRVVTPGLHGHQRSHTYGSGFEFRQPFHNSLPNFTNENSAQPVLPQQNHSPDHCSNCGQVNYKTTKPASGEEGNATIFPLSSSNMQRTNSPEQNQKTDECEIFGQNQSSQASCSELAAHRNPTEYSTDQSNNDEHQIDFESHESSPATPLAGARDRNGHHSKISSTERSRSRASKKKTENDLVSNHKVVYHTPPLLSSSKKRALDNRPSSAVVGTISTTSSERPLSKSSTLVDTLTTSLPHLSKSNQGN